MPEEDELVGRTRVGAQVLHHLSIAHLGFFDGRFEQASNFAPPILTSSWWMLTYVFASVITIINETIVKL
jgi:hypothetical protein